VMMCAVLTDTLRDAHHWLDELTSGPNLTIESLAAREGKTKPWSKRRSTVGSDRSEERPRPPVGQARNQTETARRSAL
jgi:hypothetical protein